MWWMTEGEWIGDRWSMMLSLKKTSKEKRRREHFSLFVVLSVRRGRRRREGETEKSKSYPLFRSLSLSLSLSLFLYLKQINLISSFFHFFLCFFTKPSSPNARKGESRPRCAAKNFRFWYCPLPTRLFFFVSFQSISSHAAPSEVISTLVEETFLSSCSLIHRRPCRSNVASSRSHSDHSLRLTRPNSSIRNDPSRSRKYCWAALFDRNRSKYRTDKSCKGKCWEGQVFICVE